MRVALFGQAYGAKVTQLTHREPTETELGVRDALIGLRQNMPRSGHVQEAQARGKRALAWWEALASTDTMAHVRDRNQPPVLPSVHRTVSPFSDAESSSGRSCKVIHLLGLGQE